MRHYFYYKNKKKILPVSDKKKTLSAKKKLKKILNESNDLIPEEFLLRWDEVSLYNPGGSVEKANAILIDPEEGAYDLSNRLNEMTGKEWVKFTSSWFIFNALQSDLKEERQISADTEDHPATFSPTMIESFIKFFTKRGEVVLDPFCGIGSTLVACQRTKRIGYGIELNKKYYELSVKRAPAFEKNIHNTTAKEVKNLGIPMVDFSISSPPYWNILNRSTKDFKKKREDGGLDVRYSEKDEDLGNIDDYDTFLNDLVNIYFDIFDLIKKGGYVVIIVKNVKKEGKLYPLAWDLARKISERHILKDEKIWIQDKIGLAPYGYPFSWVSNILHHYCLIFQKA